MEISEITRRNILDELQMSDLKWHGRLSEIEFLKRIFPLNEMPSSDPRFSDMAGDIHQHRINNDDWENDWIYTDPRINLLGCGDGVFLNFLCEMVHPIVQSNYTETEKLLKIFNKYLETDGYEICEIDKISGKPTFSARLITLPVIFENEARINSTFVKEQIEKCNTKLKEGDYDGAISNARSLVEGILGEIYQRCTGKELEASGDLLKDYKKVKDLLNLSEEKQSHDGIKSIVRSFNGIIQNIDTLSNRMGDRHRPLITPARHHAKLVVDGALSIADFLLSSMEYQNDKKNYFLDRLLEILDSEKRNWPIKTLLKDGEVNELLSTSDAYLRQTVKKEFLKRFDVKSYRQNDIFFTVVRIFIDELSAQDIADIYIESQTNDQMMGWKDFKKELEKLKPDLLTEAHKALYE